MRVFVTGATGFIGRHLVPRLLRGDHELVCLVRPSSQRPSLEQAGVEFVTGDLSRPDTLIAAMEGCHAAVHLAASYKFWTTDRGEYRRANVEGTRNVMLAVLESGVGKVVHVSTAAVWGDARWPITEQTPLGRDCASEYARTKRLGDEIAWELHRTRGLPLVVIHPSAVLGQDDPHAPGRYVRRIVAHRMPAQVLTDHSFSWVHVRDVAEAIARALEKEDNIGEKYLVSAGNFTFGEINEQISRASGVPLPRVRLPDWLTLLGAGALTAASRVLRRPPPLDLALDQIRLMHQGFQVMGEKAERQLGLRYTPVEQGILEEVASIPD